MPDSSEHELSRLFSDNRERLRRLIRLRMDSRLRNRVDESDVIQEAFVEATRQFPDLCQENQPRNYVWLRLVTLQKLIQIYRRHIQVQARTVNREAESPQRCRADSSVFANDIAGSFTSPLDLALRAERGQKIEAALQELPPADREILAMRHFEHLTNAETAESLEISTEAAYKRYARALLRLKKTLGNSFESFFGSNIELAARTEDNDQSIE